MMSAIKFETLRDLLEQLDPPVVSGDRATLWVSSRKLGIAKTSDASLEIFLVGEELRPRSALVSRHLEHARWQIEGSNDLLDASRIVLPSAPHFLAIAALIAVELLRAGMDTDRPLPEVFDDVEPLIELSLKRSVLGEEHLVGLVGELLCLEALLDAVALHPELRLTILDMWQGHQAGRQDFSVGKDTVEIKTTQHESSSHTFTGFQQIEPDHDGIHTGSQAYLLSIGLAPSEQDGQTLPEIVERILIRLSSPEALVNGCSTLQKRFLDDVARYGAAGSNGYDHRTMSQWKFFGTRFRVTFTPRLYDLLDQDVKILRRADLTGTFNNSDDIQFRIDFPSKINGWNPRPSWRHALVDLVQRHFGLT